MTTQHTIMKDKKGSMRLEQYLIGFIIFSAVILTMTLFMTDIDAQYDDVNLTSTVDEFGPVFNTTTEIYNITTDMKENTFGKQIENQNALESVISAGYSTLRLMRNSFALFGNILQAIWTKIPFPPYFITMALSVFAILVTFALLYIFLRLRV